MIQIGDKVRVTFEGMVTEMRKSRDKIVYKIEEQDVFGAVLINGREEHITKIDA